VTWTTKRDLPKDWEKRRQIVRRRAGDRCEWTVNGVRCVMRGSDCDHIERGGNHALENLQWLCAPHHLTKTHAEANAARIRTRREPEQHPGLRG
jgi:5-methylcytosine-specific restriction protein A